MSFQNQKQNNQPHQTMQRKENGSFLAHHFRKISLTLKERTSSSASQGSITVEASLAIGFFFFAVLCLVYLFEIMALQVNIKSALYAVSKEMAEESYVSAKISATTMEKRLTELIGEERLDDSLIVGGSTGLNCDGSRRYGNSTIMDLQVRYQIEIPIAMFRIPILPKEETIRVKGWTGKEGQAVGSVGNEIVYVTEYGIVYHSDPNCGYLDLSVKEADEKEIKELRNKNGEKYKECHACKDSSRNSSEVYVTEYGNKYHYSLECSKIKRNMYAVPIEDVYGLGGCSKCVK